MADVAGILMLKAHNDINLNTNKNNATGDRCNFNNPPKKYIWKLHVQSLRSAGDIHIRADQHSNGSRSLNWVALTASKLHNIYNHWCIYKEIEYHLLQHNMSNSKVRFWSGSADLAGTIHIIAADIDLDDTRAAGKESH